MKEIKLHFKGPFTFIDGPQSVFYSEQAKSPCIYLWTIRQKKDNSHYIHYVGETVSLVKRQREHLIQILGLNYGIFDPDKARNGISKLLWSGLWRQKDPSAIGSLVTCYSELNTKVIEYLSIINIFYAVTNVENHLRNHIEGCIGWNLRNKHPEYKVLYPDDNHIGTKAEKTIGTLLISSDDRIMGLDEKIAY